MWGVGNSVKLNMMPRLKDFGKNISKNCLETKLHLLIHKCNFKILK